MSANKYEIGIFYFSDWNPELSPYMIQATEATYGRSNDWFGGIRDMLTHPGLWGYGPIADREPLLGWYDDSQQSILDQHILQAASRGIDHFAFYYYWKDDGGGERPGQNINNFATSQYRDLLKYYICFVADGQWPESDWYNLIVPKLISHIKNSCYKRTPDGRPVISFYGDMTSRLGGTDKGVRNALEYLREQCRNNGLGNPLLVYNAYENLSTYIDSQGYDGFLPLNLAGIGLSEYVPGDYSSYLDEWVYFVSMYDNYMFIPGALQGFDTRPWKRTGYAYADADVYSYKNANPIKFRDMLQAVKNYLDAHPSSMNMATLYAWNELGEGGVIEPTTLYGYGNINAIQEVFNLDNSPYKEKVQQLGLTDIAPDLRVEIMPDNYAVQDGQSFNIKVRTKNYYSTSISSGTISLDAGGWTIASSLNTGLEDLAPGAVISSEFQVITGEGTPWTKKTLTVKVSYTIDGQSFNQSVSTFVVKIKPEKLKNYNMENDTNSDGIADGWMKEGSPVLSLSAKRESYQKSQKIVGTGYGNGIKQEWISIDPSKQYVIQFWAKVDLGVLSILEGECTSDYQWLGYNARLDVSTSDNGGQWRFYTFTFTPESNAAYASIRALTWSDSSTIAYVDCISLREK
ncbi:MAG TPA: hypothetical protein GXX36_05055 [Clostridiaceae bacterium]|nr:hypothetical protein [Clostridiaceae bacterium]